MGQQWSTSSLDLHLAPAASGLRDGLETALRAAISAGRLAPGTRLPSTRALAGDLRVARGTVSEAYAQLVAEGWLVAHPGSGTRVAVPVPATAPSPTRVPVAAPARHDLRPGAPDVAAFPRTAWLAAMRRALARAPADALSYAHPQGRPELRAALSVYLGRARGVHADPERIVVCAGFGHALALLCGVLWRGGARRLVAERHGLGMHRAIAAQCGLVVDHVDVDAGGARVDQLGDGDVALLTPTHQFPLGVALAPQRRAAAIEWAQARDAILIEDDYDGEFRYDRQPVGAMQARAPDRVVYAGTAAKSLAPGLRIAWLVVPESLRGPVVAAQALIRASPSTFEQLTLAELIGSGGYDRHVRRARLAYRRRRDRLMATVAQAAPRAQTTGIAAGLHALVTLPPGQGEAATIADAARRGLALTGLADFTAGPAGAPALVIGYGTPPEHAYTACLARLAATLGG